MAVQQPIGSSRNSKWWRGLNGRAAAKSYQVSARHSIGGVAQPMCHGEAIPQAIVFMQNSKWQWPYMPLFKNLRNTIYQSESVHRVALPNQNRSSSP